MYTYSHSHNIDFYSNKGLIISFHKLYNFNVIKIAPALSKVILIDFIMFLHILVSLLYFLEVKVNM